MPKPKINIPRMKNNQNKLMDLLKKNETNSREGPRPIKEERFSNFKRGIDERANKPPINIGTFCFCSTKKKIKVINTKDAIIKK